MMSNRCSLFQLEHGSNWTSMCRFQMPSKYMSISLSFYIQLYIFIKTHLICSSHHPMPPCHRHPSHSWSQIPDSLRRIPYLNLYPIYDFHRTTHHQVYSVPMGSTSLACIPPSCPTMTRLTCIHLNSISGQLCSSQLESDIGQLLAELCPSWSWMPLQQNNVDWLCLGTTNTCSKSMSTCSHHGICPSHRT